MIVHQLKSLCRVRSLLLEDNGDIIVYGTNYPDWTACYFNIYGSALKHWAHFHRDTLRIHKRFKLHWPTVHTNGGTARSMCPRVLLSGYRTTVVTCRENDESPYEVFFYTVEELPNLDFIVGDRSMLFGRRYPERVTRTQYGPTQYINLNNSFDMLKLCQDGCTYGLVVPSYGKVVIVKLGKTDVTAAVLYCCDTTPDRQEVEITDFDVSPCGTRIAVAGRATISNEPIRPGFIDIIELSNFSSNTVAPDTRLNRITSFSIRATFVSYSPDGLMLAAMESCRDTSPFSNTVYVLDTE